MNAVPRCLTPNQNVLPQANGISSGTPVDYDPHGYDHDYSNSDNNMGYIDYRDYPDLPEQSYITSSLNSYTQRPVAPLQHLGVYQESPIFSASHPDPVINRFDQVKSNVDTGAGDYVPQPSSERQFVAKNSRNPSYPNPTQTEIIDGTISNVEGSNTKLASQNKRKRQSDNQDNGQGPAKPKRKLQSSSGQCQLWLTEDEMVRLRPGYIKGPKTSMPCFLRPQAPGIAKAYPNNPGIRTTRVSVEEYADFWIRIRNRPDKVANYVYRGKLTAEERKKANDVMKAGLEYKRKSKAAVAAGRKTWEKNQRQKQTRSLRALVTKPTASHMGSTPPLGGNDYNHSPPVSDQYNKVQQRLPSQNIASNPLSIGGYEHPTNGFPPSNQLNIADQKASVQTITVFPPNMNHYSYGLSTTGHDSLGFETSQCLSAVPTTVDMSENSLNDQFALEQSLANQQALSAHQLPLTPPLTQHDVTGFQNTTRISQAFTGQYRTEDIPWLSTFGAQPPKYTAQSGIPTPPLELIGPQSAEYSKTLPSIEDYEDPSFEDLIDRLRDGSTRVTLLNDNEEELAPFTVEQPSPSSRQAPVEETYQEESHQPEILPSDSPYSQDQAFLDEFLFIQDLFDEKFPPFEQDQSQQAPFETISQEASHQRNTLSPQTRERSSEIVPLGFSIPQEHVFDGEGFI
jgi:hypothetical protein